MASAVRANGPRRGGEVRAPAQEWEGLGLATTLPAVVPPSHGPSRFPRGLACGLRDLAPGHRPVRPLDKLGRRT
ncbi:hypothetical protein E2562_003144 [Oryza meyeriana var. granulata]|uniref:Uncharacterized protein n=1 Tax=Oryza meyeriana var. granulata TaxID=110450 RepID=A0A6G1E9K7_9ORYZ|nr:hypothetical protein E2562_003144 [Oryza meyeriana var. granulata]